MLSIFKSKQKLRESEPPILRIQSSVYPEGYGSMEQFNSAWQNIHDEAYRMYRQNQMEQKQSLN